MVNVNVLVAGHAGEVLTGTQMSSPSASNPLTTWPRVQDFPLSSIPSPAGPCGSGMAGRPGSGAPEMPPLGPGGPLRPVRAGVAIRTGRADGTRRPSRAGSAGVTLRTGRADGTCRPGRTGVALRSLRSLWPLRPLRPRWSGLAPADGDLRRPATAAGAAGAGVDHTQVADVLLVAAIDDSIGAGNRSKRNAPANGPDDHAGKQPAQSSQCESVHRHPSHQEAAAHLDMWTTRR